MENSSARGWPGQVANSTPSLMLCRPSSLIVAVLRCAVANIAKVAIAVVRISLWLLWIVPNLLKLLLKLDTNHYNYLWWNQVQMTYLRECMHFVFSTLNLCVQANSSWHQLCVLCVSRNFLGFCTRSRACSGHRRVQVVLCWHCCVVVWCVLHCMCTENSLMERLLLHAEWFLTSISVFVTHAAAIEAWRESL